MSIKIYLIINHAEQQKKYYVGQTKNNLEDRFIQHIRQGRRENNCLIHEAILEFGKRNFTIELLEEVEDDKARERETFYIKKYMSHFKDGDGYNMKYETCENNSKHYHGSDIKQVRENISQGNVWNKGIAFSDESRSKMSKTKKHRHSKGLYKNYGHKHTEETKQKLSDIAKKRPKQSKETLEKISQQSKGRIWIFNNDLKQRKFVKENIILTEGWKKGKGMCWVNDGTESFSIDQWEKDNYLIKGYKSGRIC
jgi:group I intron endonuclease